ncbi:hypothetical protein JHK82_024946 [Glycine max]|nr:hypothetical protein JHK82_024946 [Glycine max]
MESFEAMFNENVGVGVDVDENNISCIDVEEDELNDEPKRPNKRARNLSTDLLTKFSNVVENDSQCGEKEVIDLSKDSRVHQKKFTLHKFSAKSRIFEQETHSKKHSKMKHEKKSNEEQ